MMPVPPAKTVTDIVAVCKAAIMSRTRSVKCPHVPSASKEKQPVWVILYWAEVLQLRMTSHKESGRIPSNKEEGVKKGVSWRED